MFGVVKTHLRSACLINKLNLNIFLVLIKLSNKAWSATCLAHLACLSPLLAHINVQTHSQDMWGHPIHFMSVFLHFYVQVHVCGYTWSEPSHYHPKKERKNRFKKWRVGSRRSSSSTLPSIGHTSCNCPRKLKIKLGGYQHFSLVKNLWRLYTRLFPFVKNRLFPFRIQTININSRALEQYESTLMCSG